ncbi:Ig-like domain-containing protein [Paenibacillus arenilitoris]|uniref:Ig-like domain-containing protein n=1 Tax=Paenibacillus arenilitoris TaxID=2772299 RepID=A0A927H6B2_9BACL|nr:Ig-like domain-containing protein [Paenibacillus arenilitoris]MBD2868384.1 Ig-like domain-containing protein [Paenibacillus arenilitoris]
MNFRLRFKKLAGAGNRWLASTLALALLLTSLSGTAYAADDTVTGIEFDYDETDYNDGNASLEVFVEDDKVNVSLLADISGASSKKDVTAEATWKSSNTSYVKVDKGALTGIGSGTATITATYKGFTASIKAKSDYVYDSVKLLQGSAEAPSSLDIELGGSLTLALQGTKDNETETVTDDAAWSTSNSAVATVSEGTVTLVGAGTATITAKLKGKSDAIQLKVTSPYKSIAIDGDDMTSDKLLELEVGADDKTLAASVAAKTGETLIVTDTAKWTSGNEKVVTVDKGVVTATGAGKTTIAVSLLGVTASIDVVVRTPYQSIKLTPEKEYHMQLQDEPLQLMAEVLSNANEIEIVTDNATWTSSNVVVATVEKGKVTPKAVGTTKITATHKGVSRSIDVTVYPSITELKIETEAIDGFAGISGDLPKVTAKLFDGTEADVSKLVTWTSGDEEIAVIENGKWSAKAIGVSVLTASAQGFEAEATLTVHVKPLKLIADAKEMSVVLGKETAYPAVTVINEDGEEEDVSDRVGWKSSSDNIVLKEDTVKGLEASSVTLTATYLNKTVSVKVKIEEEIVKLEVEPASIELTPGRTKTVKITGYYKSGKKVSLGSKMNWESGNINIATVRSSSVKAAAVGTTKLSGSYQGKPVVIPVVVSPRLKSLTLSTKSIQLAPGATYAAKLQANFTTVSPADVTDTAVWTTSKASVATVANGKITALGKGTASIKAVYAGKSVTIRVTVK